MTVASYSYKANKEKLRGVARNIEMWRFLFVIFIPSLIAICSAAADTPEYRCDFESEESLQKWQIQGEVCRDKSESREGSVLKVLPGARAKIVFRASDGSGEVKMWIFDDGTKPRDPKARRASAHWGVVTADDRLLAVGPFCAPYLGGDTTYSAAEYSPAKEEKPWHKVTYLGIRREARWREWTFKFDPEKGLAILVDGQENKRFDWNRSDVLGFAGIAIFGDEVGKDAQTIWVDDVYCRLGEPMKVKPTPPPPPPPVVPDNDPPVEGPGADVVTRLKNAHPRLLFSAEDIPALKDFYASRGKIFREALEKYLPASGPPDNTSFLTDATDGQRQGYWRMPTVALHYVLTGDKTSFEKGLGHMKLLLKLPHWETHELDSGMSAANIMIGAGLLLDCLWHDLPPDFREEFRRKCLHHARAMYHGGHLRKAYEGKAQYWQNDPANNHRWHRNAGLASCLLAAYTGAAEEKWILSEFKKEMDYVVQWLPEDGTNHESPIYMIFGLSHLVIAAQIADRCLGTAYLQHPFFKAAPYFMAQTLTPDHKARFNYGDMGGIDIGKLGYDLALYKCTAVHQLKNEQAALDWQSATHGVEWGWMGLIWCDPKVSGGDMANLKTSEFFADIGVLFARDGWKDDGVGVMFKCGPFGGYTLNRFSKASGGRYINVAHDDPDANTFLIYAHNRYLVESDRYSEHKRSANHNTILVNGMGQMAAGRPEGQTWSQPGGDMTKMGVVTAVKLTEKIDVIEGEASGSYLAYSDKITKRQRPALERFRRALVFAKGDYVLVLDDIRAPEKVEISWLVQGPDLKAEDEAQRSFRLINKDADCPFKLATDRDDELVFTIVASPADNKGKPLGWKQLRMVVDAERLFSAALFDVYQKGLAVSLDAADPGKVAIAVTGGDIADKWEWVPAANREETYTLIGKRGEQEMVRITAADRPADPMAAGAR